MSNQKVREASYERKTSETSISVRVVIDGSGKHQIKTEIPFLTHMIEQFAKHGLFDIELTGSGDVDIDNHHLNEDVAMSLGECFQKALGDKKGIKRYAHFYVPMDDALVRVVADICNRPYYILSGIDTAETTREDYYYDDLDHFFRSFAQHAGLNLQLDVLRGKDRHHIIEASFKALAKVMDLATQIDPRSQAIPSTKGVL